MPKDNNSLSKLKIALVYDRINTPYGGAEHVLKAIEEIFPHSVLFTCVYELKSAKWAKSFKIKTSFLQKIKFFRTRHQLAVFLMPLAFELLDLSKFDIIISITSAEAKGVLTKPNQLHICYMLTPTRYLYSHKKEYLTSKKILRFPPIRLIVNIIFNYLTFWDKAAVFRPDVIIPISKLVKKRIRKYYHLKSTKEIYPPINTRLRKPIKDQAPIDFYLSISRLVDYKKIDLSIKACLKLNKTLVVVGTGIQEKILKKEAGRNLIEIKKNESIRQLLQRAKKEQKNIIFTNKLSDTSVNYLLSNCKALLMPSEEDFGITGLEASIFGKPVIVFYKSGVAELLTNQKDALFIKKATEQELIKAIRKLETINFDPKFIKSKVSKYDTEQFKTKFSKQILNSWNNFILK